METNYGYKKYISLLKSNKNLILTGAPGTGKTYLAKAIANAMGAEFEFVQFHPSYDYTDFVEGLRPTPSSNGHIGFERKDGVFKEFCKKAMQSRRNNQKRTAKSFAEAYKALVDAIKTNNITLYSDFRNKKNLLKVAIKEKPYSDPIIQFKKTGKFQEAQVDILEKIYTHYTSKNKFDIRTEKINTFNDIIGWSIDYSYYRGIVQGLLDLSKNENEDKKLFTQCYNELVSDILNGTVETIQLKTQTSQKLCISPQRSIKWETADKTNTSPNGVSLKRLLKLYSFIQTVDELDSIGNIDDTIRYIIGGANSSYYWGVFREILLRMESKLEDTPHEIVVTAKPYVFIIDEINRGEISKIFGELFFSIDPGYRGKKGLVKTQYQNLITDTTDPFYHGFYIPENVYIIGTMNDIDRSVESMDFAMRRRFAWQEINANENTAMLDKLQGLKEDVLEVMLRLNTAIWDEKSNTGIDGLNTAYHIGGAYFCKLSLYLNEDHSNKNEAYQCLWENHLKGILAEYLRGMANATDNLKLLEEVYFRGDSYDDIEG